MAKPKTNCESLPDDVVGFICRKWKRYKAAHRAMGLDALGISLTRFYHVLEGEGTRAEVETICGLLAREAD